jgi:hypothetical protein
MDYREEIRTTAKKVTDLLNNAISSEIVDQIASDLKDGPFNQIDPTADIADCRGFYYFEAYIGKCFSFTEWKEKISEFGEQWNRNGERIKSPKFYKNRIERMRIEDFDPKKEWFPLYVGKSSKLLTRIKGHEGKIEMKSTYALRLKERKKAFKSFSPFMGWSWN